MSVLENLPNSPVTGDNGLRLVHKLLATDIIELYWQQEKSVIFQKDYF